jgi:hypothetical protein
VRATEQNGCSVTRAYSITIDCTEVTFTPESLPEADINVPYSQTFTASGGSAPYAFTVTGGAPPPGITLSTGGELSGSPTAAGSFEFDIAVAAGNGCGGAHHYILDVNAPAGVGDGGPIARLAIESLSPNPRLGASEGHLTLALPSASKVDLELVDLEGRVVARHAPLALAAGRHTIGWPLPRLRSGAYFVRMRGGSGRAASRRWVVLR